jgi:endonuclease YncB( thermonuclease family)
MHRFFYIPGLCKPTTSSANIEPEPQSTSPPKSQAQLSLFELYESDDEEEAQFNGVDKTLLPPPAPKFDMKNTIPFVPPLTSGYVIKVYDGDTITIASKLPYDNNSPVYRFHVRLRGIDSPEIKGKSEDEKRAAKKAQEALENLILHKNVKLKNLQTEKYGRILADVYYKNIHINQWMLDNHYAIDYNGGTKTGPTSWVEYNGGTKVGPISWEEYTTMINKKNH